MLDRDLGYINLVRLWRSLDSHRSIWPRKAMLGKFIVESLAAVYPEHIQSCPHPKHLLNSRYPLNQLLPQTS